MPRRVSPPPAGAPDAQLTLVATRAPRARRTRAPRPDAPVDPVASVAVAVALAHLDRPFDYRVPADLSDRVRPGVRVRVRFAGQDVAGIVLARGSASEHAGPLTPITRVVSDLPVLTPEVARLVRAVADRYAGTFADVLRAAVPPRHARAEAAALAAAPPGPPDPPAPAPTVGPWSAYPGGAALCERIAGRVPGNRAPRAVWTPAPGEDVPAALAELAAHAVAGGRGAVLVLPDGRDVARVSRAVAARLGPDRHVALTADLGPAARYRAFVRVLRGDVRVVVGTRAAVFAPVADLGLVAVWDEGDDLLAEPHAPSWHAREVAALRAVDADAALVLGGHARSAEAAAALAAGWVREVVAPRAVVRARHPRVRSAADDAELARDPAARVARLPHLAWTAAREGLARGPVLVQVPRGGYAPTLACQRCRAPARCAECAGPLAATSGHALPTCRWCARPAGGWACPSCGDRSFRAVTVGAVRTAEELGRAFPGVPVVTSGGAAVVDEVPDVPALVVATPGAEPVAVGGYAAALLLDGGVLLGRPDLRAAEEAARRWFNAVALVRSADRAGTVVIVADPAVPAVQALLRADPGGLAVRELAERAALGLPPAVRAAEVTGAPADVDDVLRALAAPATARVLGPAAVTERGRAATAARVRALVTVPLADGDALCRALQAAAAVRSAAKSGGPVVLRVDPVALV